MFKSILTVSLAAALLASTVESMAADRWQRGGNLQSAFVGQWNMAPYANKLATAALWIESRPRIKDKTVYRRMLENLRPFAFELVQCVDQSAASEGFESDRSVADLASTCMILKGW